MSEMLLKTGDRVINRTNRNKGVVKDMDNYWGWYLVKYDNGLEKYYEGHMDADDSAVILDSDVEKSRL